MYCAYHVLVQPNFRRYYFYVLPNQAQIFLDHFNILEKNSGRYFNWIRQQNKNFEIQEVKIARYNVAESGQILQWGSMGSFFTHCRISI